MGLLVFMVGPLGFEPGTNGDVSHNSLFLLLLPRLFSFVFCFVFCFVFRLVSCFVFNFDSPSYTLLFYYSIVQHPYSFCLSRKCTRNKTPTHAYHLLILGFEPPFRWRCHRTTPFFPFSPCQLPDERWS